ncbi:MFS transporter [Methanofollis fontis]|uniref:MFS transporter n=2 Tax=Methanofollis fontis TaxID=2052832 RepID=A0A483CQQ9_9EURY|nr:MFS transporter [Methanofollis fontis]
MGVEVGDDVRAEGAGRRVLIPLLMVNFINTLGFSIVIPFLIFLVEGYGGNPFIYGLLGSTYPACQLLGAPVLGRWSDLYGRRRILLLSQFGTALSWCLFLASFFVPFTMLLAVDSPVAGAFLLTLPLVVLFAARALDGITGGNVSVANAYLADITPERERSRNFGRMSISTNLGFIVGPALAGVLAAGVYGEMAPVLGALFISVAGLVVILLWLPESGRCAIRKGEGRGGIMRVLGMEPARCNGPADLKKTRIRAILSLRHIPFLMLLYFVLFLGFNIYYTSFVVFAAGDLSWTAAEIGLYFSVLSVLMVIVQGPVLSWASGRWAESTLIVLGCWVLGLNFLLLLTEHLALIYLAVVFFALGNGLMWPSFLALLSKIAGPVHQGAVQGAGGSAGGLASIVGLISGGLLYGAIGSRTFLIAAAIVFAAGALSFRLVGIGREFEAG